MKNIIGSIVEKENFFGRKKEIKNAGKLRTPAPIPVNQ